MTLKSSLAQSSQLVEVDTNNATLRRGSSGFGVARVKDVLYEMGYRVPSAWSVSFTPELENALKKFAVTQQNPASEQGVINRGFLAALDEIMLGGDFEVPAYAAADPSPRAGESPLDAAKALLPEVLLNISDAMQIVTLAYMSLANKFAAPNAALYNGVAHAFDLNFSFQLLNDDAARVRSLMTIAGAYKKASTYLWDAKNFLYAPPALARRHNDGAFPIAYYRPTDRKVYFTDNFLDLGQGGRRRAVTHELMHAAGIDHGTVARNPPYWWNLDAYHKLTPSQRLNNADNYMWFVEYCMKPFGRKQPKP